MGIFSPPPYENALTGLGALLLPRRVTAIRTSRYFASRWEHITHLKADDIWYTKEEIVQDIIHNRRSYFTREDGTMAFLIVERLGLGAPYVRSQPDCTPLNNLLSLPRG